MNIFHTYISNIHIYVIRGHECVVLTIYTVTALPPFDTAVGLRVSVLPDEWRNIGWCFNFTSKQRLHSTEK